jgi:hypothetical protein
VSQPEPPVAVLPTPAELRQILGVLGFRPGRTAEAAAGTDPQRQATVLGALAVSVLAAQVCNHTLAVDVLDDDDRAATLVAATADAVGGQPMAGLALAAFLIRWAAAIAAETTRDDTTGHTTPGPAIRHLLAGAAQLLEFFQRVHEGPGFVFDGQVYHAASPDALAAALTEMQLAAEAVSNLCNLTPDSDPEDTST